MAFSANHFPLFLLFILSSSLHTHARDSQLFNKIPTTNNNIHDDVVPYSNNNNNQQPEQPNFLPENENGYGLYGHNSGQLPPSAAATTTTAESKQPLPKYLPKNYNPVAYVTEPEDTGDVTTKFAEEKSFTSNPENDKNYYGSARNYYNTPQEESELSEYRNNHATTNDRNSYYINGGSSFNSGGGDALSGRENYFNYGGAGAGGGGNRRFQPQGMSDTRSLENGKYFYDVNTEMYSSNHPYESLRRVRARNEYNNGNYYENGENGYGFNGENSMGGYRNQDEFQIEENNLP